VSQRLVIASGNHHKVAELREMVLARCPDVMVLGLRDLGEAPEIPETADDFAGNAVLKARGIASWLREEGEAGDTLVMADDSGISVDALEGGPGVRSARFAGETATDDDNNRKLVLSLRERNLERSPAHYACVIALCRVDGHALEAEKAELAFEGIWHVEVRTERRGTGGFGYDPHAWIDQGTRTVAELARAEKATMSHRGLAMKKLLGWLQTRQG
jgi:XTP/dITP diphosphohydrolase